MALPRALSGRTQTAHIARMAAVVAVYVISGKLGLRLAFESHSVTAVWPPTGIALAALLLGGIRLWPAIAVGALLANVGTGAALASVLGITVGNTLEAVAGAWLLRRSRGFDPSLQTVGSVLELIVFGAVLSTTIGATVGVASLLVGHGVSWSNVPSVWRTYWLGDMGGDLIVAPLLLLVVTRRPFLRGPGRPLEAALLAVVIASASTVVFTAHTNFVYVLFPLLIWSALRFLAPGAAVAGVIVGFVAVAFTAGGRGPFSTAGHDERLLLAQTLVAVAESTALLLAAVTSERLRADEAVAEIAETLQHSLLPAEPPELPGWETGSHYRPAGDANQVGGDFYELFRADGGCVAVIGDVAGKGAAAASLTSLARHTLRTAAELLDDPAEGAVRHLNAVLAGRPELELCTVGLVALRQDGAGANATVVTAGHPQPFLVRDGIPELVDARGEPAGAFADIVLAPVRLELRARDILVLYTDGVTDAIGAGERFGMQRLADALRGASGAADAVRRIEQAVAAFEDGPHCDDTAVLAIMRTAQ